MSTTASAAVNGATAQTQSSTQKTESHLRAGACCAGAFRARSPCTERWAVRRAPGKIGLGLGLRLKFGPGASVAVHEGCSA
eukprot:scaffold39969_cov66-Phaeocystis_antarctica.AAC.2